MYCTVIMLGKRWRWRHGWCSTNMKGELPPLSSHSRFLFMVRRRDIEGVAIGGWAGGLFEFVSGSYDACHPKNHGQSICDEKYSTIAVVAHCINLFYTKSAVDTPAYLCLCRSRNNSQGKYRDCDFFRVNIRYI